MLIAGMSELKEAIAFAKAAESKWPESMKMPDGQFVMTYDSGEKAPDNEVLLLRVLRHGMAAAGRYLSFRLRIPDRPGELARLLSELAASGANVLDVEHQRTGAHLHLDEVEVALQLETRGQDHCEAVIERLRAAGYRKVVT